MDDKQSTHIKHTYANAGNGEWRHTAMIVNREEQKLICYLDGADEKSIDIAHIGSVTDTLPITIGGGISGALDEVGILNVPLSAEDVNDIMSLGLTEVLGGLAVSPTAKLATRWGQVKVR